MEVLVFMSKTRLLSLSALLLISCLSAQAPEWLWVRQSGDEYSDSGKSIAVDSSGNSYVTGYFNFASHFGMTTLIGSGLFIAKIDTYGNWLWAKQSGYSGDDKGYCIAIDSMHNSYVAGSFTGDMSFSETTLESTGDSSIFVTKLSTNGEWLWAKQTGGSGGIWSRQISTDSSGNSIVTGAFNGTITFDSVTLTSAGSYDVFIAKLDVNGNWLWAKKAGGIGSDYGWSIASNSLGNSYVTGFYYGTASFGATSLSAMGAWDVFVACLDSNGNWLWAKTAGGTSDDRSTGVSTDNAGNCYITGWSEGNATFGQTTTNEPGLFVAKLSPAGDWLWAKQADSIYRTEGYGITTDSSGTSFVTGIFWGAVNFGASTVSCSIEYHDLFVAKLDTNGNWLWAKQGGGAYYDYGFGICRDNNNNCYITGSYEDLANFGSISISSYGDKDIFVAKLSSGVASSDEIAVDTPSGLLIGNAYPNPFVTDTNILVNNKDTRNPITVQVFNLKGQLVTTLFEGVPEANSTFHWDGCDNQSQPVSTGVYLLRVTQAGKHTTSKVLRLAK